MSDKSIPAFLALLWAIFLVLTYFSVFRTNGVGSLGGRPRKRQTSLNNNVPPLGNIMILLSIAFVVRIALAFSDICITDITSPANLFIFDLFQSFGKSAPTLIISKLPGILADLVAAFFLYKLALRHRALPKTLTFVVITFWALNPYSLFTTANYVQTVSISFALLFVALYLLGSEVPCNFLWSGLCLGFSLIVHTHAMYFLPLALILFIFALKETKKNHMFSALQFLIPSVLLSIIALLVCIPSALENGSSAFNLPTLNAFNFYTLMDSWNASWYNAGLVNMDSRFFFLSVKTWGYVFPILSVLFSSFLFLRSKKKENIFFYCGLLTVSLCFLLPGMTPLAILPAALFFYADYMCSKSNGSLITAFFVSVSGMMNIGYIALNQQSFTTNIVNGSDSVAVFSALILLVSFVLAYYYAIREHGKDTLEKESAVHLSLDLGHSPKMLKPDWLILTVFTVVALLLNFWQLGDTTAPSSPWKATEGRETIVEVEGTPTHMSYFLSLGSTGQALQVELQVQTSNDGVNWTTIQSISESGYSYTWYDKSLSNTQKYLKFIENADYMQVLEIGLYDNNRNLLPVKVVSGPNQAFDEQDLAQYGKTYKNSMYFDEVYHGRTAYEVTEGINEYEWTHPPLGKLIMSIGISIFGMNPFGWRFMGALFGALLVPLMYLFGKKIFARTLPAASMAFLMLFDTFRLVQTRIATIDTYGVFFIILMYYFMYDFYNLDFKNLKSPWKMWRPLLLSGIFMGIGCAAKWIGFYAAIGLAILFFMALYRFSKENKKLFRQYVWKTIGLCVIFFGIIPFIIYYASYLPHLRLFDYKFSEFINQQNSMYRYHSRLESTHPYSSSWYMWPFMIRPVYFSSGGAGVTPGFTSRIAGIGNPAIWWLLIPTLLFFVFLAVKNKLKDRRFTFLIIGFLAQYLSWVFIARTTYQYHFFASLPFLFAVLIYVIFWLKDHYRATPILYVYAMLVIIAFIAIFPAVTGMNLPSDSKWFDAIQAFDTWNFL